MSIQHVPFFDGHYIAVGASLNGGNVIENLLSVLRSWFSQLFVNDSLTTSDDELWARVQTLLMEETEYLKVGDGGLSNLEIDPLVFSERHLPEESAKVTGITDENLNDLGSVLFKVVQGLVINLNKIMPKDFLLQNGVSKLLLVGEARKPWFRLALERLYSDTSIDICSSETDCNAAFGCAVAASRYSVPALTILS